MHAFKRFSALILTFLIVHCSGRESNALSSDCLKRVCFEERDGDCGYVDSKGDTVIPVGKYPICFTESFCSYGIVLKKDQGFIGIDRQEQPLFEVFPYDNGPDYLSDGLFRIVENEKVGFADSNGNIVIRPKFTAVSPFQEGLAAFCAGCQKITPKKDEEHAPIFKNGKWGFIDKKEKVVLKPKYDDVFGGFENGTVLVKINGARVRIDKTGNRVVDKPR